MEKNKQWDEMLMEAKVVQEFSAKFQIVYNSFKMPPLVTNRDLCFCMATYDVPNGQAVICTSVEHPACPEVKKMVRADLLSGGFWFRNVPEGCLVDYFANTDPKGLLPKAIVNNVVKEQAANVQRIRDNLTAN